MNHEEMSPNMELELSKIIVSLHPHKSRIGKCKSTLYIRRPCWGLFLRRTKDDAEASS